MTFSTYLIASMVLDQATDEYARFYRVDKENMATFERCCEAIDYLIEATGEQDSSLEISVDEDDKTVALSLTLPNKITAGDNAPGFGWIADWALSTEVEMVDKDHVRIHFVFPSLWEEIL